MMTITLEDCRSLALMYFSGDSASSGILGYSVRQCTSKAHTFFDKRVFLPGSN